MSGDLEGVQAGAENVPPTWPLLVEAEDSA